MDTYCWETNNLHVRWKRELGPTISTKRKIDYVLLLYIDALASAPNLYLICLYFPYSVAQPIFSPLPAATLLYQRPSLRF